MKKRFLAIIACVIVVITIFTCPISVYAEEITSDVAAETMSLQNGVSPEASTDMVLGNEGEYHTLFTRIWEFIQTNQGTLIDGIGFAVLFVFSAIAERHQKKKNKEINKQLKTVGENTSGVATSQNGVVGAVNQLIGEYNHFRESYEKYETAEDDRNKLVGAMVVQNAAILDILETVYVNSKNLPQGVKDIVTLKYAKCLSTLENDDKLRACVKAVHEVMSDEEVDTEKEDQNNEKQNEGEAS